MNSSSRKTSIDELLSNPNCSTAKSFTFSNKDITKLEEEELITSFHDGETPIGFRRRILNEFFRRNPEMAKEQLTIVSRDYTLTGSKDQASFVIYLLDYGIDGEINLDMFNKFELAQALYVNEYHGWHQFFIRLAKDYQKLYLDKNNNCPSVTFYISILNFITIYPITDSIKLCINWLLDKTETYSPDFLYRTIRVVPKDNLTHQENRSPNLERHISCTLYMYERFFTTTPKTTYKILAGQFLLQNKEYSNKLLIENNLLDIALSKKEDYNTRADSADTLIRLASSQEMRIKARDIIRALGSANNISKKYRTIYDNAQNVHEFDDSVTQFLLQLRSHEVRDEFENVKQKIIDYTAASKYKNMLTNIRASLTRVELDNMIYPGSQYLTTICVKIFSLIQRHEFSEMLMERLVEELIDMENTCSSGHASRFVNIFSGLNDDGLKMNFQSQIYANLVTKIERRIQAISDDDVKQTIMDQYGLTPFDDKADLYNIGDNEKKKEEYSYLDFLRDNLPSIREELYNEFCTGKHACLDENAFTTHFRLALAQVETGVKCN